MSHLRSLAALVLITFSSAAPIQTQDTTNASKHFAKDRVSFDYPAGWKLTASSLHGDHSVKLEPPQSAAQIVVQIKDLSGCDFGRERQNIEAAMVKAVAQQIRSAAPVQNSVASTEVETAAVDGTRLTGVARGKKVIADVYLLRLHRQTIGLVHIRPENDETAIAAWNTVRTSLKVESVMTTIVGSDRPNRSPHQINGGVLNGKAIRLPAPTYPPIARQAHASGTVKVQVVIDESGAVISAHAVEGHPLLQAVSVSAARQAQFSPTKLCGEPVGITGVITYNFVPQ